MAIRQIRVLGDDVLRKKCKEVKGETIMSKIYRSILELIGNTPIMEPVHFTADKNDTKNAYISRRYV